MYRGFIAVWRQAGMEDMSLDPHTHKLWMLLNLMAQHAKWKTLQPGDLITSLDELGECLREYDHEGNPGKTFSRHTTSKCLEELVKRKYITMEAKPSFGLRIAITDWTKMQGKKPKGYNYHRHEYPTEMHDDVTH